MILLGAVAIGGVGCQARSTSRPVAEPKLRPSILKDLVKDGGIGVLTPKNTRILWTATRVPDKEEHGGFHRLGGKVEGNLGDAKTCTISVDIDIDSVFSDHDSLTEALKGKGYFDATQYPQASFRSTAIVEARDANYTHQITGDLSMRGIRKSVALPAQIKVSDEALQIEAEATISRMEFGVAAHPEMVKDLVTIRIGALVSRK
jgi:polyisoprenoid-binding protein YceI